MPIPLRHLTYANVMSTLAVFIAFGGSSFAAIRSTPDPHEIGQTTVLAPRAVGGQTDAMIYKFGDKRRAAVGQQGGDSPNPGSGVIEVTDGLGERTSRLSHYQYGTTLWSTGVGSHMFEFLLGDEDITPTLSVRGATDGHGAKIEARDSLDHTGMSLNYEHAFRPTLTISDDAGLRAGATMGIDN